jgi:hypothetical protein
MADDKHTDEQDVEGHRLQDIPEDQASPEALKAARSGEVEDGPEVEGHLGGVGAQKAAGPEKAASPEKAG